MLFLDLNSTDIQEALDNHVRHAVCIILKRSGSTVKCVNDKCWICNSKKLKEIKDCSKVKKAFKTLDSIKSLLIAQPHEMLKLEKEVYKIVFEEFNSVKIEGILKDDLSGLDSSEKDIHKNRIDQIKEIFDYENWFVGLEPHREYSAYHLSSALKVRSCVYCNRTYTVTQTTVEGDNGKTKKLTRPQFDHWFPKEKHPLLALSFYNLIPSCSICNSSIKGRIPFDIDTHIHPYVDNVISLISFNYEPWSMIDDLKVTLSVNCEDEILRKRIERTLEDFHIGDLYNAHLSELKDLLKTKQAYSENYLSNLKNFFNTSVLTDDDIYRLAFGTELKEENFHNRPFSKFKYDLLKELEIIK